MNRSAEILKPKGISLDRLQTLGRFTKDVVEGFFFNREAKCQVARFIIFGSMTFLTVSSATYFIDSPGKTIGNDEWATSGKSNLYQTTVSK